jgi:hypothetical protein
MTPHGLLGYLVALFPDFRAYWDAPDNCFRDDDGSFTLHGLFMEFTSFFKERHATLPAERVAALGAFVSECMAAPGDPPLGNAAATCFVENIAGDPCDRELAPHLTGDARRYWKAWGGREERDVPTPPAPQVGVPGFARLTHAWQRSLTCAWQR